ncbi:MAG: glycosyltransferase family 2 protein [Actinomycetota bacterium]
MSTTEAPGVSVVVLNHNGIDHLRDCFGSLRELDYPKGALEMVCVDNASTDGSLELLEEQFPEVRVIRSDRNLGFAAGCNLGARSSEREFVALVNNDMRVDPNWLRGLVEPIDRSAGAVCSAGKILSWDGAEIDFVRGTVTMHGSAAHVASRASVPLVPEAREDLPFASGGSMLVDREVFLAEGGFDQDYFAFLEDVDFGWRLWLHGYRTVAAPNAVSFHRLHGTAGAVHPARLERYYQRNALFTLVKNLGEHNLGRMLASSMILAVARSLIEAGVSSDAFDMWESGEDLPGQLDPSGMARLVAIRDLADQLPSLMTKRIEVQSKRVRSDSEIFEHFARPLEPMSRLDEYLQAQFALVRLWGIDEDFSRREASTALFVAEADEPFSEQWLERANRWAAGVAASFEVTATGPIEGARITSLPSEAWPDIDRLAEAHEIVFAHLSSRLASNAPSAPLLILDLSGVDPSDASRFAAAIDRADAFVAPDAASVWREALDSAGRPGVSVIDVPAGGPADALIELCRNSGVLFAERSRRRLDRFTHDLHILQRNWAEERSHLLYLEGRVVDLEGEAKFFEDRYRETFEELERVRNHFVMKGYSRLRKFVPIRKDGGY